MVATEPIEDALDVALSMIDTRAWGARLRVVSIIRVLQRRSEDGIARIGHKELARRAGITSQYGWMLFGTGKSAGGLMWRVEHILELVDVGTGQRPTGWRLRPIERWRGVPWLEQTRELRRLRLDEASRAPDRDTNDGVASRGHGATQRALASRSDGATLDDVASRWRTRRKPNASVAPSDRDAKSLDRPPTPSIDVGDVPSPPMSPTEEQQEEGSYIEQAKAALFLKTGATTKGRLIAALQRFEAKGVELSWLVRAINAAPATLKPPMILDEWLPMALKHGIPGQTPTAPAANPEVDRIQRELAKVERQILGERLAGDEPPPYLVADRERWQNELDQLTGAQQ